MYRRKLKSLAIEVDGSVEIFTLSFGPVDVVFASHHLEIVSELLLDGFGHKTLWRFGVNGLSALPVISEDKLDVVKITYLAFCSKKLWSLIPLEGVLKMYLSWSWYWVLPHLLSKNSLY